MLEIDLFIFDFTQRKKNQCLLTQNTNWIMKNQQGCKLSLDFFRSACNWNFQHRSGFVQDHYNLIMDGCSTLYKLNENIVYDRGINFLPQKLN